MRWSCDVPGERESCDVPGGSSVHSISQGGKDSLLQSS